MCVRSLVRSSFVTLCTFHGTIVNLNITKWMYKFLFSSQVSSTYAVCVRALFYLSKTHHRFFTFAFSTEHLRNDGRREKNYVSANCYFSRSTITAPRIEREYKTLDATKIRNIICCAEVFLIENSFGRFRAACVSIASTIVKSSNNKIEEDEQQPQQQKNFLCDFLRSFA